MEGSASELIEEWRMNLAHRRRVENRLSYLTYYGAALGFLIGLAFVGATVYLVTSGHPVSGTILGTVDLAALISVFVFGVRQEG